MMAILNYVFIGILILQIYVNAAPSDVSKLEDIAKVEKAEESTESTTPTELEDDENSTETTRQKRFYNPYAFGFPPINPGNYPNFNRQDEYSNPENFGVPDPLVEIHRRVQEIANFARQPPPPGIPPHFPVFYPVLFVPPFDCQCNPNSQPTGAPTTDGPPTEEVTIESRLPNIDDRQNWGVFINNTNSIEDRNENNGVQDFRRPISFDPIRVNRPSSRPAPPVEHGTLEGDPAANQKPQSSGNIPPPSPPQGNRPSPATRPPPPPPSTRPPFVPPQSGSGPQNSPFNPNRQVPRPPQNTPPSTCDSAILTCCHRLQVTYDCFAIQGCPNFTPYGNPCDPNSILRIIRNFERYYGSVNNGYNY